MLVLDTDHFSEWERASAAGGRVHARLEAVDPEMAVTVITVEEQMRGWLAEINRQREPHRQIAPYAKRWIDSMILNQIKAARKS